MDDRTKSICVNKKGQIPQDLRDGIALFFFVATTIFRHNFLNDSSNDIPNGSYDTLMRYVVVETIL